jgi:hypothetical protein
MTGTRKIKMGNERKRFNFIMVELYHFGIERWLKKLKMRGFTIISALHNFFKFLIYSGFIKYHASNLAVTPPQWLPDPPLQVFAVINNWLFLTRVHWKIFL